MAPESRRSYMIDTNVLSHRADAHANPPVAEWLRRYAGLLRISVVTMAEMHRGLILLETKIEALSDGRVKARKHARLTRKRAWYEEVAERFADRLEPIDLAIAEKWAEISVRFPSLRDADKAIAATALAKNHGVATENIGDFRRTGVHLVNPFDRETWDADQEVDPIARILRNGGDRN